MADFLKAYKRTCGNEGGYANNPNDRGGETWKGIARRYHGDWPGWVIIDHVKTQCKTIKELNAKLFADQQLEQLVVSFYKYGFWDISQLDRFSSQHISENVFDASVNCGAAMGPHFLQETLNNLKAYGLTVDNVIGNKTFAAMSDAITAFGEQKIVDTYVNIREAYHRNIVAKSPDQKVNLSGWISRCESMRKAV